jgi:hypothetical protein
VGGVHHAAGAARDAVWACRAGRRCRADGGHGEPLHDHLAQQRRDRADGPLHYPPLFPWLVGHTAALLHTPAWQLLGLAETIAMSAAVVAGFALWRRLVAGPVALALSLMVPLCFALPQKGYEVLALAVVSQAIAETAKTMARAAPTAT